MENKLLSSADKNKVIAEFMGYKYKPHTECNKDAFDYDPPGWRHKSFIHLKLGGYLGRTSKELKYDYSWDWLMQCIEQIEALGHCVFIVRNEIAIKENSTISSPSIVNLMKGNGTKSKLEIVYQAVYEFILWYNKQIK